MIAPDARGHGDSDWTRAYSFDLMRDDVVGLMDGLGILGAIVVGHSMGALTAYRLAATRPELIRLLVLEEMPPPDPAKPPRPIPRQPEPDADHDWRAVIAVRRWRNDPPKDWWDLAGQIPSKTLVIGGAKSYLPQPRLKEISQRIPNGTFTSAGPGPRHPRRAAQRVPPGWSSRSSPGSEVGNSLSPAAWPGPPILGAMSASLTTRSRSGEPKGGLRKALARNGIPRDPDLTRAAAQTAAAEQARSG